MSYNTPKKLYDYLSNCLCKPSTISHIDVVSSDQTIGVTNNTNANVGINTVTPIYTLDIIGVDGVRIPVGTTNERPLNPNAGIIRYNTSTSKFEGYNGTLWVNLSF